MSATTDLQLPMALAAGMSDCSGAACARPSIGGTVPLPLACVAAPQRLHRVRHLLWQAAALWAGLGLRPPVVTGVYAAMDHEHYTARGVGDLKVVVVAVGKTHSGREGGHGGVKLSCRRQVAGKGGQAVRSEQSRADVPLPTAAPPKGYCKLGNERQRFFFTAHGQLHHSNKLGNGRQGQPTPP
jgi:hypothetical protein